MDMESFLKLKRKFTDADLIQLHSEGLNDRLIGERFGASESSVRYRRYKLGLIANQLPKVRSCEMLKNCYKVRNKAKLNYALSDPERKKKFEEQKFKWRNSERGKYVMKKNALAALERNLEIFS